jgi:hypothetical protein
MTTQTKDYTTRSAEEAKTHELFDFDRPGSKVEWTPNMAVLAMVWKSQYHAAIRVEDIQALGKAIGHIITDNTEWLQPELTALCRAKVLRSYRKQGKKLYEVNY